jgi:hypothetical protein
VSELRSSSSARNASGKSDLDSPRKIVLINSDMKLLSNFFLASTSL